MLILGIILSVFAIGFFCWLLFTLAVYALPFFVGLAAAFAAYHTGYGVFAAALIAIIAGGAHFGHRPSRLCPRARTAPARGHRAALCGACGNRRLSCDARNCAYLYHARRCKPDPRRNWRGTGRRHGLEPHGAFCIARHRSGRFGSSVQPHLSFTANG